LEGFSRNIPDTLNFGNWPPRLKAGPSPFCYLCVKVRIEFITLKISLVP